MLVNTPFLSNSLNILVSSPYVFWRPQAKNRLPYSPRWPDLSMVLLWEALLKRIRHPQVPKFWVLVVNWAFLWLLQDSVALSAVESHKKHDRHSMIHRNFSTIFKWSTSGHCLWWWPFSKVICCLSRQHLIIIFMQALGCCVEISLYNRINLSISEPCYFSRFLCTLNVSHKLWIKRYFPLPICT